MAGRWDAIKLNPEFQEKNSVGLDFPYIKKIQKGYCNIITILLQLYLFRFIIPRFLYVLKRFTKRLNQISGSLGTFQGLHLPSTSSDTAWAQLPRHS